jgi:SAM-dependent methyltransferase
MSIKAIIKKIPVVGDLARQVYRKVKPPAPPEPPPVPFDNSANFWEQRYATGGNSGVGSYDKFAKFKAEVLNEFVRTHSVQSVLEFGCGDGNQLTLARYPRYTGYDVSATAVAMCKKRFDADSTKTFRTISEYADETADLTLSLDVIFHLVEDTVFESYMRTLFGASRRYAIIYSSNTDENEGYAGSHVWHRKFTQWVDTNLPGWKLVQHIPNRYPYRGDYTQGSFADFFIYEIA